MSLLTSIVSYWKLDEASGNALDAHGSNTLTETSGTIAAATGIISGARDFELGDTEYFNIADNADLSTGDIDFTITVWVNLESRLSYMGIVTKWSTDGNREYALAYNTSQGFYFFVTTNGFSATSAQVQATTFGNPSAGVWCFVVVWHDATANTLNICVNDGTVDSVSHSGGVANSAGPFQIGAQGGGSYFDGMIDEVGLWKRVLTSAEITALYNGGAGLAYSSFGGGGTFTASAAVTTGATTASASGTFAPGTKTATATVSVGASTAAASGTFAAGTKTASASVTGGVATVSASATFAAGTKTATATVTAGATTASGSGTTSDPIYTASVAVSAAPTTASGTAIFATVVYQANAAVTAGATTAAGTGTTSDPVYTGTAGVTVPVTTASGSGTFSVTGVFNASAAVTTGVTTASGTATFTPGSIVPTPSQITVYSVELTSIITFASVSLSQPISFRDTVLRG